MTITKEITVLEKQIAEEVRLTRFFVKLLGEVLHLEADCVLFTLEGGDLIGSIRKARSEVKSISIKPSWFQPMQGWLNDRFLVTLDQNTTSALKGHSLHDQVSSAVRIGNQVACFKVRYETGLSGKQTLQLSQFSVISSSKAIEFLGLQDLQRLAYEELICASTGVIIIAAPDELNLRRASAAMLALSGASRLGEVNDSQVCSEAPTLTQSHLGVATIIADDGVDAILHSRELGWFLEPSFVKAIVCQSFARKVCAACARQTPISAQYMERIPQALQAAYLNSYLVGRGCNRCGHTGYSGMVGLTNFIKCTEALGSLLKQGADQIELTKHIYSQGSRSLFEIGLRQASEGATTFESIFESIKGIPDPYLDIIRANIHKKKTVNEDSSLDVTGDFFVEEGSKPVAPIINAAFTQRADDNAPLFTSGIIHKSHTKPIIMVVEDDPDQRSILDLTIKSAQYEVQLARDGQHALELLQSQELPDLILTDLMMPNLDGRQLVHHLKHSTTLKNIPVMVLTVISDVDSEYDLLSLGAEDYCDKTVQRKILLKRIENLIKRSKVI